MRAHGFNWSRHCWIREETTRQSGKCGLWGDPYMEINDNEPEFNEEELTVDSYGTYSELDSLGRCGTAQACVGRI